MPWKGKTVMDQKESFLVNAQAHEESFTALCRRYGISRKTGYKWLRRAENEEPLTDRSRQPHTSPRKTPEEVERLILTTRDTFPQWGGKKIKNVLESSGYTQIPSAKTCSNILKRNGKISPEESKKHMPCQRFEREECNELWQTDFKGDFLLQDGVRCYPLDILDDHTRFCLLSEPKERATGVKESFEAVFKEYGLPKAILSDNGGQFAGFKKGITQFERYLMDLDIEPIHGRIMHPQTQGKIERFHRTMKEELLSTPLKDMKAAIKAFAEWRWRYNNLRPHNALGMKTPGEVYRPSSRKYETPREYVYATEAKVRKVNNWGYLRFGPVQVYLSETFANTYLEIRPVEENRFWIIYRNYKIGTVDAITKSLADRTIRRL